MKKQIFFILIILCSAALGGFAQSRILPVLEANPDVRTAGMGNTMLGNTAGMHLYVNPSALVFSQQTLATSFTTEIFPDTDAGRLIQYNFSAGCKIHENRAFFAGFRYQGGLSIPVNSNNTTALKPKGWVVDLGYAFAVSPEVSVYGAAGYAKSELGRKADGMTFSVGIGYHKELTCSFASTQLTLGARLMDMGKALKYDKTGLAHDLPTSVAAGGDWSLVFAGKHRLVYALSGRYFTPKGARLLLVGTGLEYVYNEFLSARMGYQYGQNDLSRMTFGIGCSYAGFRLDASYGIATASQIGVNTLMTGISYSF